jgi:hypothetical protein
LARWPATCGTSRARADRVTYLTLGVTGDGRATGATFSDAGQADVRWLGGSRLTLGFEDRALPIPADDAIVKDVRLVPELLAGFLSDDHHAEGYLGAGLRGEAHLASRKLRTAIYAAARGLVIGGHHDDAVELVLGEYILLGHTAARFGWEGGAIVRTAPDAPASSSHELDAVMTIYVGRPL